MEELCPVGACYLMHMIIAPKMVIGQYSDSDFDLGLSIIRPSKEEPLEVHLHMSVHPSNSHPLETLKAECARAPPQPDQ